MENTTFSHQLIEFLAGFDGSTAYATILGILFACGLGLPIPEDITLIAAGMLAAAGTISLPGAYFVGYLGVLVGDALLFFAGRKYGKKVFTVWPFKSIMTPERILQAEGWIQNWAKTVCFVARFLPGLRAPIYLTSGVLGVKPSVFLLQDGLAALLSVPIWVALGHWFGSNIDLALEVAKKFQIGILILVFFLILGIVGWKRWVKKKTIELEAQAIDVINK
ncbi:MAG: DedA family protein [Bdellovibrionales bacterium]